MGVAGEIGEHLVGAGEGRFGVGHPVDIAASTFASACVNHRPNRLRTGRYRSNNLDLSSPRHSCDARDAGEQH
jgi:hypothetical protein